MTKPEKVTRLRVSSAGDNGAGPRLAVTLTVDELRSLIADVVKENVALDDNDALLNVDEAAKFLHQSPTYIYRTWRELGGRKVGKNLRFTKADLRKWIATRGA